MVDATSCVSKYGGMYPQHLGDTDGENHLLHRVPFIIVETTLGVGKHHGEAQVKQISFEPEEVVILKVSEMHAVPLHCDRV